MPAITLLQNTCMIAILALTLCRVPEGLSYHCLRQPLLEDLALLYLLNSFWKIDATTFDKRATVQSNEVSYRNQSLTPPDLPRTPGRSRLIQDVSVLTCPAVTACDKARNL